jgi:NTE family protein
LPGCYYFSQIERKNPKKKMIGNMKDNHLCTGVVLQGGGALGAYEYGAIKALYEKRPGFTPTVITGLSIGSVNAAILAGAAEPIQTLDKIWREDFAVRPLPFEKVWQSLVPATVQQNLAAFGNQGMYSVRPEYLLAPVLGPFFTSSFYDTSPLRATLENVVDPALLNSGKQVVVTAVDVATGKLVRFGNTVSLQLQRPRPEPGQTEPEPIFANTDRLTLDHILASCSLPPGFPRTAINGHSYWDGGLRSNTPLSEAINGLEAIKPNNGSIKREVIVVELVPMAGGVPQNIQEVWERILGIIFSSKLDLDAKLFHKMNTNIDLFEAINALLSTIEGDEGLRQAINAAVAKAGAMTVEGIRAHPGYQTLQGHRKINAFTMIPFKAPPEATHRTDFSRGSIEQRIAAGYDEAIAQNIGEPNLID